MIKKIDSTLRGNIGAEIEALMKACGITGAVVAPAFPQAGRTTVAGECWVNGVRITETEFASDPKTGIERPNCGYHPVADGHSMPARYGFSAQPFVL